MDGGRRLLQSLTGAISSVMPARLRGSAVASANPFANAPAAAPVRRAAPRRRLPRRTLGGQVAHLVTRRGFGSALAIAFMTAIASFSFARGGQYEEFVRESGRPIDIIARVLGFGVEAITITGQRELLYSEILAASGVSKKDSVLLLDAQAVRANVKSLPLVQEATVRKLYPDQLVISVTERKAFALWQIDGEVSVIASDGAAIDKMRDQRFARLPFVVGEGANKRVEEYLKLLHAAGDFRSRITAGVLVSQRRWNLKLNNGVDIRLPEAEPEKAVATLAKLAQENKLPDRDIIAIDFRVPGRIAVRLSEEAAAKRLEAKTKKSRTKGGAA